VIYFHLYIIQFLPNNQQHLKGQVETLRDETRGLRIGYANTRYNLAQLRLDHAHLSNSVMIGMQTARSGKLRRRK